MQAGAAVQVLAALGNGILNVIRQRGWQNVAAVLRYFGPSPQRVFYLRL